MAKYNPDMHSRGVSYSSDDLLYTVCTILVVIGLVLLVVFAAVRS